MNTEDIQDRLTYLYQELNAAENDLYVSFNSSPLLDSGEENWVRDQERYIESLKAEINSLTEIL